MAEQTLFDEVCNRNLGQQICPTCGKPNDTRGMRRCTACRNEDGRIRMNRLIADRRMKGVCIGCACCGQSDERFLSIDHIHNDGAIRRKADRKHAKPYRIIKDGFPSDFQILCFNCNFAKQKFGICPHEIDRIKAGLPLKCPVPGHLLEKQFRDLHSPPVSTDPAPICLAVASDLLIQSPQSVGPTPVEADQPEQSVHPDRLEATEN